MNFTDPNLDLELIAAFIDGRLSGEARARAVKMLADSDQAREIFANALRVEGELPQPKVVAISSRRGWRQSKVMLPLAAAAVLALAVLPTMRALREPSGISAQGLVAVVAQGPRFAEGLGAGWEQRGWAVTRGAGPTREGLLAARRGTALDSTLAFRLGVRSVDLQVALVQGDSALADRMTNDLLELLKGVEFSEMIAANYTELRSRLAAESPAQRIDRASGAERKLSDVLEPFPFNFGKWVGAAELAARTHNASFFNSKTTQDFIRSAIETGNLAAEDAEALRSIATRAAKSPGDRELDEIRAVLQTIIAHRGG